MKKIRWTTEALQEEALKFNTRREFSDGSPAYQTARARKLLDQICQHMRFFQKPYTYEDLKALGLKYKNRTDFFKKSNGAFQVAIRMGVLEQICGHMPRFNYSCGNRHYAFKWTLEKIQDEALKYSARSEFRKFSPGAYNAARRSKILDQVCSHMKPSNGSSFPERELKGIIKEEFPTAKSLRDTRARVANKPHILGFDIDIYIPELRKGIEFDGEYWHSLSGLKKSRPNWPTDDLLNYHQLKDNYFLSKDIQIIHIKEEDWNLDKENCIQKCFDFLNLYSNL